MDRWISIAHDERSAETVTHESNHGPHYIHDLVLGILGREDAVRDFLSHGETPQFQQFNVPMISIVALPGKRLARTIHITWWPSHEGPY